MTMTLEDRSHYLRGLLILIRKDRKISRSEKELVLRIGKSLGFETKFTKNAIRDILANRYISEAVPCFSSTLLAERFLIDALTIACFDKDLHPDEEAWLHEMAVSNKIDLLLFEQKKNAIQSIKRDKIRLEVEDLSLES